MTPGNPNQDDGGEGKRPNWARTVAASSAMRFEMDSAGVGYDDLALKYDERESYGFEPVYPNLKQVLLTEENHPYKEIAHALVTCSAYAYSDSDTLSMIMTRMGLENNRCRMITQCVDAMLI